MSHDDLFGNISGEQSGNGNVSNDSFDLNAMMGIRSNQSSASEQVEKVMEAYAKIQKDNPAAFPYKLLQIRPDWIGDKELVIMYLAAKGKVAITPILFGADVVEEGMRESSERMIRAANYNITKFTAVKESDSDQTGSRFLNLCIQSLQLHDANCKLTEYTRKTLELAGCIIVRPEVSLEPTVILAAATSELRAGIWRLHGTQNFSANEPDINFHNHRGVTTVVDLTTAADTRDLLGGNVFSPIKIRLSHYRSNALSGSNGKQLTPKLEISGYLDFRPLTAEEITRSQRDNPNRPAPLLVPQFVWTGMTNRYMEGVATPTMVLDALGGIAKFRDEEFVKLMEQCAQYQTTVDPACSTYDWNYLGTLLALEVANRGFTPPSFEPCNPVHMLTGQKLPTPMQRSNAILSNFAPMEVLIDVPQSGEMANVRQQLLADLGFYHYKLTGKQNTVQNALGSGMLVPQGEFTRVSEKNQEMRDIREKFNVLGMLKMFHHGNHYTDNFTAGVNHSGGKKVIESDNLDRHWRESYNFINNILVDDGSFRLDTEQVRVVVSREYLDRLEADQRANEVTYEMRHSGAELINRITATVATTNSINFQNIYG